MKAGSLILIILTIVLLGGGYLFMRNTTKKVQKEDVVLENTSQKTRKITKREIQRIKQFDKALDMEIDKEKKYSAKLITDKGNIIIRLTTRKTPATVNNFIFLAKSGFYDNTTFHRVIKGFMIQGGDPLGDGTGGPGYKFDDEDFEGEYTRGTVAMANSGPNTNGSQFFILHKDKELPKNYVIFGKVTDGMDVVDTIVTLPVSAGETGETSKPINPVKINRVEIIQE